MQFIYPIGLLAAAAIIIPVIIHLWNIKQGKTLKIGSIALLGESSRQSSRSLLITDWPLLILRCLLLITLAFLLAKPFSRKALGATDDNGWIVIEKSGLKQVSADQKKTIDSLLNIGYELHELNTGFTELNRGDTSEIADSENTMSYPSLVKQLNATLPKGFKVYAFADSRMTRYEGDLPQVSINLNWNIMHAPDSVKTWISKAYFTNKDNIRAFLTYSSPTGNYTETFDLNDQTAKAKKIEIRIDSGNTKIKTPDQSNWVPADTSSINVTIYAAGQKSDGTYVQSAVMAIRQFTDMKISVTTVNNSLAIPVASDLVFWLSDAKIDKQVYVRLKKGACIFSYESGKEEKINSVINTSPQTNSSINYPELYKHITPVKGDGEVLWRDGFGLPVLTLKRSETLTRYHFYSRFDPQYTDLVWSASFVKALMPVIIPSKGKNTDFGFEESTLDTRRITNTRLLHEANFMSRNSSEIYRDKPLTDVLWLIAMLLFTAERIVTFSKNRQI